MARTRRKSIHSPQPEWAKAILALRQQLGMNQSVFAERFHSSSMVVSRWERGASEPPSHSYVELGNLAGDPQCWFFWERAGFRSEDLLRVMPGLQRRLRETRLPDFEIVAAGSGGKKRKISPQQLVAIPVLKIAAASHGEKSDARPASRGADRRDDCRSQGLVPESHVYQLSSRTWQFHGAVDL